MPDHEPRSPWSPQAHHEAAQAHASAVAPAQPAHAWISADPYGVAPSSAPPAPAAAPAGSYAMPPIEVRVAAPTSSGRGLAILGVVLGGLALLSMGFVVVVVGILAAGDDGSGGGGYGPLRGTVAPAAGSTIKGSALADEVTRKLEDEGDEPEGITCPDTVEVGQDVTTVCHGTDFGDDAAFVVFFEDQRGSYTLLEV